YSGSRFTTTVQELAAGDTATFTIIGYLNVVNPKAKTFEDGVRISSFYGDNNLENNVVTASVPITTDSDPGADLLITTATPGPGVLNHNLTYKVRAFNLGPDPASSAYIGNILPDQATFGSASSDKGTVNVNGKYINVSDVSLGVGESATLTLNV